MTTLRVVQETYGWTLRLGQETAGLFDTRPRALEHARWLRQRLRESGERAGIVAQR